ncbi:MAG: choice-of-anchor D domain-containing protein [Candidatus Sulfotelmatobacter sp.]
MKTRRLSATVVPAVALALVTMLPLRVRAAANELSFSPTSLHYGDVVVGQTRTLPDTVTNHGKSRVTISGMDSSDGKFKVSKPKLPAVLAAGKSLKVNVTFAPTAKGWLGAHVTVLSNASDRTLTLDVGGTGVSTEGKPKLTIAPATLSFGKVGVGSTETLTLGLSATDGGVTISSVSSSSSQFAVPGVALPLTIPAGHELSLNVTFTPQNSGKKSATLSFASNAENSPASEPLAGTGTAPYVTLSWNASTSQVSGYNIYRSKSRTGSLTRINSSLDPDTTYTDANVVSGSTYYYATTAVNSSGQESGYSNRVEVAIP